MNKRNKITRAALVCVALAAITLAAFWPVTQADFVNIDDPTYVQSNVRVHQGLTWENVKWAFSTFYFSNWHPLTWLSYMLDCELFGVNARAMHWVNLGWHVANTLLLFGLLTRATAATGASAIVAALFAVHPLHVESVAWISERKDVLSTFFWLASTWAYVEYVKARCAGWYTAAIVLCGLGLMCKAMLVTLPFALLLLDLWPLQRFVMGAEGWVRQVGRLALEKLPFFAMAAAAAYLTFLAQRAGESVIPFEPLSVSQRIENVFVSYARYIGKMLWPANLAPFYPHPVEWPAAQVIASLLLLAAVSFAVVLNARRRPFLFTGWFWFVGTLVPVIGLVQVGSQSLADRYTYVPLIGLLLALVWLLKESRQPWQRQALGAAAIALLLVCGILTFQQSRYWQDSLALFTHAARVTPPNVVVLNNLGAAQLAAGLTNESERTFGRALKVDPEDAWALGNVSNARLREGKLDEALALNQRALRSKPNIPQLHLNAGLVFAQKGDFTNAIVHYERALELNPFYLEAHINLGNAWIAVGSKDKAAAHYSRVVELNPRYTAAYYNLGNVLLAQDQPARAAEQFSNALRVDPRFLAAHRQLAVAWRQLGKFSEALQSLERAAALSPTDASLHAELGVLFTQSGRPEDGIRAYRRTLELAPDSFAAMNNLAWLLATHPQAEIRDGAEAVRLAERAVEMGQRKHAFLFGTLGAAYAEAGRFEEAIRSAEEAIRLAEASGEPALAKKNRELLAAYRERRPWREPASTLPDK